MNSVAEPRLSRLLGYLVADPANLNLLGEAAEAAFEDEAWPSFDDLIARYGALSALPPVLLNLRGLSALRRRDHAAAAGDFAEVLRTEPDAAQVRFNLAWCLALLGDWAQTADLIDEAAAQEAPAAAALKVQALHHLGELDAALSWGRQALERRPDAPRLASALAAAALDVEQLELAARYADLAGDQPQAHAVQGMLLLGEDQPERALQFFETALAQAPSEGRALLGVGLAKLALGDYAGAAGWIDKAADVFRTHAGSWVASAWAYFAAGDAQTSRARFEAAMAADDAFAEVHGGLAVLDVLAGDLESARRRADVALRLDRECFAAALARVLLLTQDGDHVAAERLRTVALNTPAGLGGRTIAQAMSRIGRRPGGQPGAA